MADKLVEKREELASKQAKLAEIFETSKKDDGTYDFTQVKSGLDGDQAGRVEAVRKMNDELADLAGEVKDLGELADMHSKAKAAAELDREPVAKGLHPASGSGDSRPQFKSLGELVTGSAAVKDWKAGMRNGPQGTIELPRGVEAKTTFSTSAGWAPQSIRTGMVVESAQRPPQVLDLIPGNTTDQAAVVYMEETTFTNNAAETSEGSAYVAGALALTERTSTVRKIAVCLPVTDEQLEDIPQAQAYVNNRLTFMIRQRLDLEIMEGDGVAPDLDGFYHRSGTQSQAKGTDPTPDAIYKAIVLVRTTGRATPNAVVLHSADWQDIRLLRTADGIYIWGSPSSDAPPAIWGLPVVLYDSNQNTGLVGDFANFSQLSMRRNLTVQVGYNNDDFTKGIQTIRADLRASLEIFRAAAFCKVTGI